jgi:murein DD-endopeptidase MepM/ murein hydrolase activator NlpD
MIAIVVLHDDGTFAECLHIKKDGARVSMGDKVAAGDLLAISGNVGSTSEPHLHFHVAKRIDVSTYATIPVKFKTADSAAATLEEGQSYQR